MLRRLSATPCPVDDAETFQKRNSVLSSYEETTANLDFTTEFKASFRDVKPRRPPKTKTPAIGFTIHEDEELKVERGRDYGATTNAVPVRPQQGPDSRAKMAKERRVSFRSFINEEGAGRDTQDLSNISRAPRRSSIRLEPRPGRQTLPADSPKIAKPARRGTIFIPSDDTTMPTMFMDIFSPLKRSQADDRCNSATDANLTGLAFQMAQKRGRRTSTLTSTPKRVPLVQTHSLVQTSVLIHDRPGQGPGKENLPPGHDRPKEREGEFSKGRGSRSTFRPGSGAGESLGNGARTSRLFEPTASSAARAQKYASKQQNKPKTTWNSNFLLPKARSNKSCASLVDDGDIALESKKELRVSRPPVPSRFVIPSVNTAVEDHYLFVPEGVADASMYEQNWLGQQEVAITQLINNLFDAASLNAQHGVTADLSRLRLLDVYGNPEMSLLYKRVQACLLHGPLCLFGEGVHRAQQLYEDLARRRAYTQFWLTTYDPRLLRLGLEVVVGRVVPLRTSDNASSSSLGIQMRPLQLFLEKFMIRNEDFASDHKRAADGDVLYQRTILRSLMLVKLLDLMKTDGTMQFPDRLFQAKSEVKSSNDAAVRILRMLNPSAGDVTRPLRNLGYVVSHEQYPLEEFNYKIENLAVDVRDGVRLTRLAELLLYRGASQSLAYDHDLDATATITIPSGMTISLAAGNQEWPISQHLKLPCDSRAAKLYNVNLALAALKGLRGMSAQLHDLTATHIVDGFREKTVHLLWMLCSKYGLGGLIDWNDIKLEVKRLGRARGKIGSSYLASFEVEQDDESYIHFKGLLRIWVKAIAKSHGLHVRNFTTDFADGKLFDAIVSEYQPYLTGYVSNAASRDLGERLTQLGCSNEFAKLFVGKPGALGSQQIFDRDFVLASLAFLASRLLRPSKAARAALVLQRAWRRRSERVLAQRKKVLNALATSCAERVRIVEAKNRIWRAWRQYRARKTCQAVTSPSGVLEDIWLSL